MPKLPPPPRMAQKRSGFSAALATSKRPSAVTISAESKIAQRAAVLADHPAESTTEGETADAGGADKAAGGGEGEGLQVVIQFRPGDAGFDACSAAHGVDMNALYGGEIDDQAIGAEAETCDVVAGAAYGHEDVVGAREMDAGDDVGDSSTARDERRAAVNHEIVRKLAGFVVVVVGGSEESTAKGGPKILDNGFGKHRRSLWQSS